MSRQSWPRMYRKVFYCWRTWEAQPTFRRLTGSPINLVTRPINYIQMRWVRCLRSSSQAGPAYCRITMKHCYPASCTCFLTGTWTGICRSVSMQARKWNCTGYFQLIVRNSLAQPKVFVHRDYHSRNLMVTSPNPGILDFQDAVYGPITYDLVSLFKDAYIRWDEERVLDWLIRYWEQARKLGLPVPADFSDFYRDFEWMGVQRHLKVLGIFARLNYRDGKSAYLGNMPLVEDYLRKACERYKELDPLLTLLDEWEVRKPQETKVGYTF